MLAADGVWRADLCSRRVAPLPGISRKMDQILYRARGPTKESPSPSGVPPSGRTLRLCGHGVGGVTVVVLPFGWGLVAENGAEPASVVPAFDPGSDGDPGLVPGSEYPPVDELFFQGGEEGFGGGVVPADPGAADRLEHPVSVAEVTELSRGVLGASVCVKPSSA